MIDRQPPTMETLDLGEVGHAFRETGQNEKANRGYRFLRRLSASHDERTKGGACLGAMFHAARAPQHDSHIELLQITDFVGWDCHAQRPLVQPLRGDVPLRL